MPHSQAFRTASTKYVAIPPSFFARASQRGQSSRSSKHPSVQPDHPYTVKMSFASQQAARLVQQRVAKQKEAMAKGTTTKVFSMTSSTPSTTSTTSSHRESASSTSPSISSSSSQKSQDICQATKTLHNLEDRLDDLLSSHLNIFSPHLDPHYLYKYSHQTHLSVASKTFTAIALGELLNLLEQELGFVEAQGNKDIEVRRKNVANRIKETMAYLEKIVHDFWWIGHSKQA